MQRGPRRRLLARVERRHGLARLRALARRAPFPVPARARVNRFLINNYSNNMPFLSLPTPEGDTTHAAKGRHTGTLDEGGREQERSCG